MSIDYLSGRGVVRRPRCPLGCSDARPRFGDHIRHTMPWDWNTQHLIAIMFHRRLRPPKHAGVACQSWCAFRFRYQPEVYTRSTIKEPEAEEIPNASFRQVQRTHWGEVFESPEGMNLDGHYIAHETQIQDSCEATADDTSKTARSNSLSVCWQNCMLQLAGRFNQAHSAVSQ